MQQMRTPGSNETEVLLSKTLLGVYLDPILSFLCSFRAVRLLAVLFCSSCLASLLRDFAGSYLLFPVHADTLILAWTMLLSF